MNQPRADKDRKGPNALQACGERTLVNERRHEQGQALHANLHHGLASGKAVTGVLRFINKTPIDWFSKKQATVETATYGSEFSAARTAIQQTTYQSLIGALQWTITLGRFDIAVAVMTMSGYRVAPRMGHLERLKRIVGYLEKMKAGFIRIRTGEPDLSDLPPAKHDWSHTVYGNVTEVTPDDAPIPLGKPVVTVSYVDANLYHDWTTGRAVTGVLHFVNQTPIEWFCKKQATVETATYGSEFVAAKQATEQIMGLRTTLRYLGVPIKSSSRLFGDNGSVVTNASTPHSPLKKRHHALWVT